MAINTESDDWREIEEWAKARLDHATTTITAPMCEERRADFYRGVAYSIGTLLQYGRGKGAPVAPEPIDY